MPTLTELLSTHGDGALDIDALENATRESMFGTGNPGYCVACGEESDGCEPDAEGYHCENCGEYAVCGAESLFMTLV